MNNVEFDSMLSDNNLEYDNLPESIQVKIERFDELYEEYKEVEDDDPNEAVLLEKMRALDKGIVGDLKQFLSAQKKAEDDEKTTTEVKAEQVQQPAPAQPSTTSAESPSWRFWM